MFGVQNSLKSVIRTGVLGFFLSMIPTMHILGVLVLVNIKFLQANVIANTFYECLYVIVRKLDLSCEISIIFT